MPVIIRVDRTPPKIVQHTNHKLYITNMGYLFNDNLIDRNLGVRLSLAATVREWDALITEGGLWHV